MLLALPILIPALSGVALLLLWRQRRWQRRVAVGASATHLAASLWLLATVLRDGILATQLGGWPAPFGITLVADILAATMAVMGALMGFCVTTYSLASMERRHEAFGYYPLVQFLLMGVSGSFLTGDIFNLYVWFEVMLMASFVLLALGGGRAQLEGAVKYVTLNLFASAIFLAAVGMLYAQTGTLNMAHLSLHVADAEDPRLLTTLGLLFFVAFGIKAAVFPLFFWLPASYHTPPVAVSALFAGLLTKVGVYAMVRMFTLVFTREIAFTHSLLLAVGLLTMVTGVLGAAAHYEFRRILSFHIVSQIGYMIMGLGLYTRLALAGSVFYIVHNIIAKTNTFLVAGMVQRLRGTGELKSLGGLYRTEPLLALLFLIPAFGLAGVPPLSGFFAKLTLLVAAVRVEAWVATGTALVVGILTLFSMTKIWAEVFWKDAPATEVLPPPTRVARLQFLGPIILLATLTVLLGVCAGPVLDVALRAADELMNPAAYVTAVLGGGAAP